MNSLSWFLYLASVFDSIGTVAGIGVFIFASVAAVSGFGATAMTVVANDPCNNPRGERDSDGIRAQQWAVRWYAFFRKSLAPLVACLVMAIFVPSSKTMYAIAASEVGERVAKSEPVQGIADDATKALHQWIKKQIEPEKKG